MATKTKPLNNQALLIAIGVLAGLLVGYFYGSSRYMTLRGYNGSTGQMMRGWGQSGIEYGQLMDRAGVMMQERGERWGDTEMLRLGEEMMGSGGMMGAYGQEMMGRGEGMMGY